MARYSRYRRSYFKKSYPRKRWATNINNSAVGVTIATGSNSGEATSDVCSNSTQAHVPTPVIVKFGRVKIKGDVRTSLDNANNFVTGRMFVCFVPQGVNLNLDLINDHPEYIIGWTTISMDSGNTFSFSSALKRNLNSGDSIKILFRCDSFSNLQNNQTFGFSYVCQFWTTSA